MNKVAWLVCLVVGAAALLPRVRARALDAAPAGKSASARPERLSETGLYLPGTTEIDPDNRQYEPQYPLWSDGASKRRWLRLPPGSSIDARDARTWQFPVGTRFWKEFGFGSGERTETRYIERLVDGSYRYASYVWDAARGDAFLAPSTGLRGVRAITRDIRHDIPAEADCRACHEGRRTPVLGFDAVQLSSATLDELIRRGQLRGVAGRLRLDGRGPEEYAVLGYFYGNCAHCHQASGPLALDLDAAGPGGAARVRDSVLERVSAYRLPGEQRSVRVRAQDAEHSALWFRMQSRFAAAQMPPLGTKLVDARGVALVRAWIQSLPVIP